ncbi:hypothetical protein D3C83_284030 [compost metagenome]
MTRVKPHAAPSPSTRPTSVSVIPRPMTSRSASPARAPRATLMPSSRVDWLTENEMTP